MKLNLYIDKTRQFTPKGAIFFEDETSYFEMVQKVYAALKSGIDLIIIARRVPLKELIRKAFSPYNSIEIIEHEEITFKTLLKRQWNISVFDFEPSDKEILDQKLLDLDYGTDKPQTFSEVLLSNTVSPLLSENTLSHKRFGSLLNDLVIYSSNATTFPPVVKSAMNYKFGIHSKQKQIPDEILSLLFNTPFELYEYACLSMLIQNYPSDFQRKVLDQKWSQLLSPFGLKDIDLTAFYQKSALFQNLKNELGIFFAVKRSGLTPASLFSLVDQVSGHLSEELEFFIELLTDQNEFVTDSIINKLTVKFSSLDTSWLQQLFEIKERIKPPFNLPSFNASNSLDQILLDAVDFYYPYKIWSDNTGTFDLSTFEWGQSFSEFMLKEYEKVSYHFENFIHRFIHNQKQRIKDTDLAIVLVVDNLNYKYFKYLNEAFNQFNITLHEGPLPYVSLLPTTTSVGKFAIFSGKRDKLDSSISNYGPLLNATWKEYFPDHTFFYYHANLAELSKHKVKGKEIIFINYLGVDEELHSSPKKTLVDHKQNVKLVLNNLSTLLNQFIKRNRKEDNSCIFFISDHGSTQISDSYHNPIKDIQLDKVLPSAVISEDHRFIKVHKNDIKQLESNINIKNALFCMNDKVSGDGNNYVIAKGYGRFKGSASDSYIHGGATPEEIIIPGGYFSYRKTKYADIIIQLSKLEYRYLALETFIVRFANPNDKRIEQIQIEIFENEVLKVKTLDNEDIEPKGEIQFETKFKLSTKGNSVIRIITNYRIDGTIMSVEKEIPVKVKSMVESSIDMDNLLNL